MKGIFHNLPSLASDYSGACGVLLELGGLTVLCDASGCSGSFLVLDDPRWYTAPQRFYCAALRETDVVLGFDSKLVDKLEKTHARMGGTFAAVVGTPVPTVVATDYEGICREVERRLGIPAVGIDTSGLEWYDVGQAKTYQKLLQRFADPAAPAAADVHVIGATPLDMWDVNQTNDLLELLKRCGARSPVAWGSSGAIPEIASVPQSRLNVAVSVSALPAVRELKEKYGTPYVTGFPTGRIAEQRWIKRVTALLSDREVPAGTYEPGESGRRALILGEQVAAESLRALLYLEFGFTQVDVASYFTLDEALKRPDDRHLNEEDDLAELVKEREPYDAILGDPLLRRLLPVQPACFVPLPHTAISSRAFWSQSPNCLGAKGSEYMRDALGTLAERE